jgi:hypothetical protein
MLPFASRTQWQTVGGWLRSITQTRRLVAGSNLQTVRVCSIMFACVRARDSPAEGLSGVACASPPNIPRAEAATIAARCTRIGQPFPLLLCYFWFNAAIPTTKLSWQP